MGKAVTRGQALELVGQFCRDTNWDALSSEGLQTIIDLSPEERTAHFTSWLGNFADFLKTGVQHHVSEAALSIPTNGFSAFRKFLIGGVAKKELLRRVEAGFTVSDYARSLVKNRAFTTLSAEESIDTIILTPKDFGYERNPTTTELFDPARLAEWSKQNVHRLPEGYDAVELNPAEAGPHIRDQYKDQPNGEVLWIAMERITDSGGNPRVFSVKRNSDGKQWLNTNWTNPDNQWNLDNRIVFRLRNLLHFSLAYPREFCFITCPYQPPSIFPTSESFCDISAYCFVSSNFISQTS